MRHIFLIKSLYFNIQTMHNILPLFSHIPLANILHFFQRLQNEICNLCKMFVYPPNDCNFISLNREIIQVKIKITTCCFKSKI